MSVDTHPQRTRARVAIERLAARPDVLACDLIPAGEGVHDSPTIELTVEGDSGIPPKVAAEIGKAGVWIREVRPRMGEWMTVIATAEEAMGQ